MVPKVFAHRGASVDFPEHTLLAYQGAIDQGADGFECDVRLTKDSLPILWHDSTMDRTAGISGDIAGLTYHQIRDRYPQVMTLTEFLELAIAHKKDLLLETKHPVPTGREVEEVIGRELKSFDSQIAKSGIEISIMSFSWTAIESVCRSQSINSQKINSVMLVDGLKGKFAERYTSARTLGPSIDLIKRRPQLIASTKRKGRRLFVWTVDQGEDVAFCAQNGVDAVITNKPAQARKVLGYP